ncbi:tRNA (guanine10-N2)-methyltransferase [Nematocida major]|uniref:tRNA (guanine10-N2)-methyltransferase n=1 Tax=Nematocida major TaxID=1912982 RepID=UPI002008C62B|nr:tRNA (guanine10-N2)-methyltransferase [Nematocida major]KAH9385651.1 tRNA (guanine10-N2)-methyltransferase [Nematocida major]
MPQETPSETFLLLHVDRHAAFIKPELDGLLKSIGMPHTVHNTIIDQVVKYTAITASAATIDQILEKSMLVSRAIKVHRYPPAGAADSKDKKCLIADKLHSSLDASTSEFLRGHVVGPYKVECMSTFKSQVIEQTVTTLRIPHPISVSAPEHSIYVIEESERCIVGVLYKDSLRKSHLKYSVKNRKFIGNTSMDNEMAFILCNASGVTHRSVLLDCYAGSGSIILSGALQGAFVIGTDISKKQFKGRDVAHENERIKTQLPNTNIYSNFAMYNVSDRVLFIGAHDVFDSPVLREGSVDVILCDPPYGERETVRKKGSNSNIYVSTQDEYLLSAIPFLGRTVEIGRQVLRSNGRIGIFMPHKTGCTPALKEISGFSLVGQAEQYLNSLYSRSFFLLEMSKGA